MENENLVSAKAVSEATGIPIATIYRLAARGTIPSVLVNQPWYERTHRRFYLSEVLAKLTEMGWKPPK
jgi:hypothetical protein